MSRRARGGEGMARATTAGNAPGPPVPTVAMPLAARGAATETSSAAVRSRALSEASAAMSLTARKAAGAASGANLRYHNKVEAMPQAMPMIYLSKFPTANSYPT